MESPSLNCSVDVYVECGQFSFIFLVEKESETIFACSMIDTK